MFIVPPTEKARELALQASFSLDRFTRLMKAKDLWTCEEGAKSAEARRLIKHYVEEIKPNIDKRAESRGMHIDGERLIKGPEYVWLRDSHLDNDLDNAIMLCLVTRPPGEAQVQAQSTPQSRGQRSEAVVGGLGKGLLKGRKREKPIDWTEECYAHATAAVRESGGARPVPVDLPLGSVLQLDEHEELYARPGSAGTCVILFVHEAHALKLESG